MEKRLVVWDQRDSSETADARRDSNVIRSVNSNLRKRSEAFTSSERIAFFCECEDAACYLPMWMSVAAFDELVSAEAGWLLFRGHQASALWHRREPLPTRQTARSRHARNANDGDARAPAGIFQAQDPNRTSTPARRLSMFLSARQGALSRVKSIKQ